MDSDALRKIHACLTKDLGKLPNISAEEQKILAQPVLIGQPVLIHEGAVLRVALSADIILQIIKDTDIELQKDTKIIRKLELVVQHFEAVLAL